MNAFKSEVAEACNIVTATKVGFEPRFHCQSDLYTTATITIITLTMILVMKMLTIMIVWIEVVIMLAILVMNSLIAW